MKKKKKIIIIVLIVILLIVGVVAVYFLQALDYKTTLKADNIKDQTSESKKAEDKDINYKEDINAPSNIINILFLGIDKAKDRELGVYRSDVIAIAKIDLNTNKIKVLSIPRDTYTYIPIEGKKDKINHAYAYGGIKGNAEQSSIDTVEQFLGKKIINYYFVMDMDPIPSIVDKIGGIKLNVDVRMNYPDYDVCLEPGIQVLTGKEAYLYLNWRYSGAGDIDRIKRVQYFMSALLEQLQATGKVMDTLHLLLTYKDSINTDLSTKQLIALGVFAKQLPDGCITYFNLEGRSQTINGISYWIPDPNTEIINNFLL
jgi:polyisoprenyl-teichoic acid--peptidoglycan teichoic acid transferase